MCFDKIITSVNNHRIIISNAETKNEFIFGDKSLTLYVIFPPWNSKFKLFDRLKNKILKKGDSYLAYEFPKDILSSDVEKTVKSLGDAKETVIKDLDGLVTKYGFSKIVVVGFSLGSVEALMISNDYPAITDLILIAPSHSLAESIWDGILTKGIRKSLESKGTDLEKLKVLWAGLAPENNLANLGNRNIYIEVSKADMIAPYAHGKKLIEAMEKQGIRPEVKENLFLGHYLTIYKNLICPKLF